MSKELTSDLFQKAKDQVAKKNGFDSWENLRFNAENFQGLDEIRSYNFYLEEAAELYASLQNAELQRENESLRKQLHEHNGICQEKLSEQLNSVLPEIKLLKEQNAVLLKEVMNKIWDAAESYSALNENSFAGGLRYANRIIELHFEKYTDKK